ncbi:MAG: hypothetical protein JRN06_06105 [Nitrososphaerota archaeon]|nr:hypothetical protein [Nitrososphaerota archaeon]
MTDISRQYAIDINSLISTLITVVWLLIIVGVIYWFYRALKRIERALLDIKKLLEGRPRPMP